jgi:hypothetical protein
MLDGERPRVAAPLVVANLAVANVATDAIGTANPGSAIEDVIQTDLDLRRRDVLTQESVAIGWNGSCTSLKVFRCRPRRIST